LLSVWRFDADMLPCLMLQEEDEDDDEDDGVNDEVNDDDDDAMPSQQVPTDLGQEQTEDLGKVIYRLLVVCYFVLLPSYFWYRWLYTIEWDVPYRMYYQTTICVAEMFGAICVMMLAVIRFPQPWAYNQAPPKVVPRIKPRYVVHCCVPCYNEPSDLVFATCEAALQLKHEWAKVYVYMLDDGRNLEREKKCMEMGNERLIYLARNKWPGVPIHGKAGNVNSALKFNIFAKKRPRDNDIIVIFDADMKAHPNFLQHVLPYFEDDPQTAIAQTPQHFFNVDHAGDVFNHQNSCACRDHPNVCLAIPNATHPASNAQYFLLRRADRPRRVARDCLLRHQLRRTCRSSCCRGLVPDRVDHRGLLALAQIDRVGLALPVPWACADDGRGAR
jgi:hypothetical protein